MSKRKNKKGTNQTILFLIVIVVICIASFLGVDINKLYNSSMAGGNSISYTTSFELNNIPEFTNEPYVVLNDNKPEFNEEDFTKDAFEEYSKLDYLGRCGIAYSCVGIETMPQEERGAIGSVKPTGWQVSKYDFIDGKYLYNRCHLIGYQLTAENANEKNLITGTRYMNVEGMLPFENIVAQYIKETENHVLYRVTPIFEDKNLIASGVQMEAYSVEDNGEGVCFNVYVYNVQPRSYYRLCNR